MQTQAQYLQEGDVIHTEHSPSDQLILSIEKLYGGEMLIISCDDNGKETRAHYGSYENVTKKTRS